MRESGDPGTVYGTVLLEAVEVAPAPAALSAVTVKVYAVPFASPVTVIGEPAPVPVKLPGVDMTV